MKTKQIIVVFLIALVAYYYWFTFRKPCKCDCASGSACKCKKNVLEKMFEKINTSIDVKRAPCSKGKKSIKGSFNIPDSDKKIDVKLTGSEDKEVPGEQYLSPEDENFTNAAVNYARAHDDMALYSEKDGRSVHEMLSILKKLNKELVNYETLIRNIKADKVKSFMDRAQISKTAHAKAQRIKTQMHLISKVISAIKDNAHDKLDYSIYLFKDASIDIDHPDIKKYIVDYRDGGKRITIICKRPDVLKIGELAQAKDIIPIYWKEWEVLPEFKN